MKKYTFNRLKELNYDVFKCIGEDMLDYSEYSVIPTERKIVAMTNKIEKIEKNVNNITFIVSKDDKAVALWVIIKDEFDSGIFNFDIYRIVNLIIIETDINKYDEIIDESFIHLKKIISKNKRDSYFLIGMNTNFVNTPYILNKLINKGFYYIHTLITFKMFKKDYPSLNLQCEDSIKIREAKPSDVEHVMSLARKSFRYSRFHLDPFLDKNKANHLLAESAKNSILNNFVDIMFVAEIDNKVVGYYSAKKKIIPEFNLTFGDAIISAVDENYRGAGIFKLLNKKVLKWFAENTDISEMGTYIANTPVHKTWCNSGLSIIRGTHQLAILIKY